MVVKNPRNNFYDFQKINLEDVNLEQTSNNTNVALTNSTLGGNGVLLDFPEERVIFDSSSLTTDQSGFVAVGTFDGRGILAAPVDSSDLDEGTQVSVTVTDARLDGAITMVVTVIGKLFDDSLTYEHLEFTNNGVRVTKNHYKEVTNIMFQNFLGNNNTFVDGYGSFNVGGTVLVTEASSYKVSLDLIAAEQIDEPDIIFRNYKVYNPALSLQLVLEEAIGTSNDVDELDVNTTTASTRRFAEDATTETIYAQKFQMEGTNIQKISLLLGLESGTDWSGTLVVGIRPLLTSTSCPTDFLPENEIEFDPDTVPLEEIALDQADFAARGIVLDADAQVVDFVFTQSQLSNPNLSRLVDGDFYVITVRRTGSTSTGSLFLEEARNDDSNEQRLTVFSGNSWTDVPDSTLWYRVWSDSVKVASGTAYDEGIRLPIFKTEQGDDGVFRQNFVEDVNLINTSENTENYLVTSADTEFLEIETHPRTGDDQFSRKQDVPAFTMFLQSELLTRLILLPETVVLSRVRDQNPRSNPQITGSLEHPGLALGNTINIVNPPSDLLNQNVIGSTIIPNTGKVDINYRIISQEIIIDGYGDVDGDGDIDLADSTALVDLDGYHVHAATTGDFTAAQQQALLLNGDVDILEVLRSDLNGDGYINTTDINALTAFLNDGTAFPHGLSTFTRVKLGVEPILDPLLSYDDDAMSILQVELADADLTDPANFGFGTGGVPFRIDFLPTWEAEQVEILDLRRFVTTTFTDFDSDDIQLSPESGGQNNLFVPGDLFLTGNVKELDGTFHPLDSETNTVEFELPAGDSEGEVNVFEEYVAGKMKFSDGTFVANTALNDNQVKFEVQIGSHVKNLADADGYDVDFDGYNDGYGSNADEAIGTYIDHTTGLMRIRAFNIVENEFFPELRSRILVTVSLKKAGFINSPVTVDSTELALKLQPFAP